MSGSGTRVVERAGAEPPPGGVEGAPGLVADLAVDGEPRLCWNARTARSVVGVELVGVRRRLRRAGPGRSGSADLRARRVRGPQAGSDARTTSLCGSTLAGRGSRRLLSAYCAYRRGDGGSGCHGNDGSPRYDDPETPKPRTRRAGTGSASVCRAGQSADSMRLTSSPLGLAPATDWTGWPPLKTVSVGTDITR